MSVVQHVKGVFAVVLSIDGIMDRGRRSRRRIDASSVGVLDAKALNFITRSDASP